MPSPTDAQPATDAPPAAVVGGSAAVATAVALLVWANVVVVANRWGTALLDAGTKLVLPTPPLLGAPGPGLHAGLLIPVAVAAVLIVALPSVATRVRWRTLMAALVVAGISWSVGLALAEGVDGLTRGPSWSTEYLFDVERTIARDPAAFLRTFTDDIERYEVHVRGHPPGMALLLSGLARAGLSGVWPEVVLIVLSGASAPVAVASTVRLVCGEDRARAAAPFLALAPAAIWTVSSADAVFAAVAAWSGALAVAALHHDGRALRRRALCAGTLAGAGLLLSYGLVLAVVVPFTVASVTRPARRRLAEATGWAALGAVAVVVAFVPFGFWWVDGLAATRHEYAVLDLERPYDYFLVANLAAWAVALGPATIVAMARLRDRRLWGIVGGAVAAAALANVSGLSEGEVERIWLPFTVWALAAGAAFGGARYGPRPWLALQATTSIVAIAVVTTQW